MEYSANLSGDRLDRAIALIFGDIVAFCTETIKFLKRSDVASPSASNLSRFASSIKYKASKSLGISFDMFYDGACPS